MMASSERRMREIRTSGATSGDWKRSLMATAPVLDSTKSGGEQNMAAARGVLFYVFERADRLRVRYSPSEKPRV